MKTSTGKNEIVVIILLAVACYFPIFLHLSSLPFRLWDESRYAKSAYEMSKGGNLIAVPYGGAPDMWNTKPPLMIWLQAASISVFGLNELAPRLPSGLAALCTCMLLLFFCHRFLGKIELGVVSVLVLVTSAGYIRIHVTRTGDFDSLLTLLTTAYLLCYFVFIEAKNEKQQKRFLLYFFIAFTLTALCKGIQGLMFAPALIIYTGIRRKVLFLLKQKEFYIGVLLIIVFGFGYYVLRESINPGYLRAVWNNELGGRFNAAIEGHEGPFHFYWDFLLKEHFNSWYFLLPCGLLAGIASKNELLRNFTWFLFLAIAEYFFLLSSAKTKIDWYDAPLIPLLALIAGLFLSWLYNVLRSRQMFKFPIRAPVIGLIALFLIFIKPYAKTVQGVYNYTEHDWEKPDFDVPNYLKHAVHDHVNVDGYKIIYNHWQSSVSLYQTMLEERNQHIQLIQNADLKVGDKVILADTDYGAVIAPRFKAQSIERFGDTQAWSITSTN